MAKTGTYNIQEVEHGKPAVQDSSYKSFLCILLVFISFCALIILLSTISWGSNDKDTSDKEYETIKGGYHGNEFEKLRSSTEYAEKTSQRPTTTSQRTTSRKPTTQYPTTPKKTTLQSTTTTTTHKPIEIEKEQTKKPSTTAIQKPSTTQKTTITTTTTTTQKPIIVIIDKEQPQATPSTTQKPTTTNETQLASTTTTTTQNPIIVIIEKEQTETSLNTSTTLKRIAVSGKEEKLTTAAAKDHPVSVNTSTTSQRPQPTVIEVIASTKYYYTNSATEPVQVTTVPTILNTESTEDNQKLVTNSTTVYAKQTTAYVQEKPNATKSTEKPVPTIIWFIQRYLVTRTTQHDTTTEEDMTHQIETTTEQILTNVAEVNNEKLVKEADEVITTEEAYTTEKDTTIITSTEARSNMMKFLLNRAVMEETTTEEDTTTDHELETTEATTRDILKAVEPLTTTLLVPNDTPSETTVVHLPETTTTTTTTTTARRPVHKKLSASKSKAKSRFKSAVSRMLNLMDHSQDPCEDFYMYSCGGTGATVGNPADDATWNGLLRQLNDVDTTDASDAPLAKLKTFHKSCVEHEATFDYRDRLEQVTSIIEEVGKISTDPILVDDLTRLFAKLALTKSIPFLEVHVGLDSSTQSYVFQLSPPYRSLAQDDVQRWSTLFKIDLHCLKHIKYNQQRPVADLNKVYSQYTNCKKHYSSYLDSFNITTHAFDDLVNVDGLLWSVDNEILNFTTSAFSITSLRDAIVSDTYTTVRISYLSTRFRSINWELFFHLISGRKHPADTKVYIFLQDALFRIFDEFVNMQRRHLYNYLYAIYTNDVYQNVIIPKEIEHREEYCGKLSTYLFGDVVSYLYMKALSSDVIDTSRKLVDEVFKVLKVHLNQSISGQVWLDHSKREIVNKVNSLTYVFQEKNNTCISKEELKIKYDGVFLEETFGANYVKMVEFYNMQKYKLAGTKFNVDEAFCNIARPFDRNPTSVYAIPIIAVPYGMVHAWSLDYPSYFLMGKVGIKIAVEIMRFFDPVGIRGFTLGKEAKSTYKTFTEFSHDEETLYQNKRLSVKISKESNYENIRDNAALRLAYSVFNNLSSNSVQELPFIKNDFNEEQIFLISMAQEFCENLTPLEYMLRVYEGASLPNYWRVNNMVVSSKRFKEVHECKAGANLNPEGVVFNVFPDEIAVSSEENYDQSYGMIPSETSGSNDY